MEKITDEVDEVAKAGAALILLNPVFDQTMHLNALAEALNPGK